jgi:nuclear GTP-binding protein
MVSKKRPSKRQTLSGKYKIQRKVREHHRKIRSAARKNPGLVHRAKPKDPGIPNTWPFKDELLQQMEDEKARRVREKEGEKKRQQMIRDARRPQPIEEIAADAARRAGLHENALAGAARLMPGGGGAVTPALLHGDSTRRFYRDFKKVVESSDVVLEVLDARDPLGCRCPEIERQILAADPNKRIVLILNKIDLVPREVAEKWVAHLRGEYPTLVFKCNTQSQRRNLSQGGSNRKKVYGKTTGRLSDGTQTNPDWAPNSDASAEAVGASALIQLLKNYSRNHKIKTSVTVGVIGYPNVGKSSLINSLKRSRAANVGNSAGVTKSVQEIAIDSKIKILDCPGIVFATGGNESDIVLRNAVKVQKLTDPLPPIRAILARCDAERLMELYNIPDFDSAEEFLYHVARRQGKLMRGGIPDVLAAGRIVIADWNTGKIPFYTEPPAVPQAAAHVSASIAQGWAATFDVDSLEPAQVRVMAALPTLAQSAGMMRVQAAPVTASNMFDENEAEGVLDGRKRADSEDDEGSYESAGMEDDDDDDDEGESDMGDDDDDDDDDEDGDEDGDDDESGSESGSDFDVRAHGRRSGRAATKPHALMNKDEAAINPMVNQAKRAQEKAQRKKTAKRMGRA